MKKFPSKISSVLTPAYLFLLSAGTVFAQYDEDIGGLNNEPQGINYTLQSPLWGQGITSFADLLTALLEIFIIIATPIVVLFIIFAGFKYVTARGNATQVQDATRAITYAIIGGLLILGAVAISVMITGVVNSLAS